MKINLHKSYADFGAYHENMTMITTGNMITVQPAHVQCTLHHKTVPHPCMNSSHQLARLHFLPMLHLSWSQLRTGVASSLCDQQTQDKNHFMLRTLATAEGIMYFGNIANSKFLHVKSSH